MGILRKERGQSTVAGYEYNVEESLDELGRLAKAAGLEVVGHTHQVRAITEASEKSFRYRNKQTKLSGGSSTDQRTPATLLQVLSRPDPASYIGSGKVVEVADAVHRLGAQTVIFDDELSPAQLRNLERRLGEDVRVCDRTALILDIFSQRAATREGQLQVELAQMQYQVSRTSTDPTQELPPLPRFTDAPLHPWSLRLRLSFVASWHSFFHR